MSCEFCKMDFKTNGELLSNLVLRIQDADVWVFLSDIATLLDLKHPIILRCITVT